MACLGYVIGKDWVVMVATENTMWKKTLFPQKLEIQSQDWWRG